MESDKRGPSDLQDGRPVGVRDGEQPQSAEDCEDDIPDASTVENVGY
ncbi:MAG: hypothetical protein QOJ23_4206 [Actinomycetota bacterium]|jgi:hypothetical protein|nr:hypothetical protein [Actinomycetota bacterium]